MLPREKLMELGVEALTIPELFSIVIGSGTSKQNVFQLSQEITSNENFRTSFLDKRVEYWTNIHGIGPTKAARLVASLELALRLLHPKIEYTKIQSSNDVFAYFQQRVNGKSNESFYILCLDNKNQIIFDKEVHSGFRDFVMTDMKDVFTSILMTGAKSFICVHNHPSGDTQPSPEDRELTMKILHASKILDLQFLDHVIVSTKSHFSFCESESLLFR